jgi:hypothetical protein
MRRSFILAAVIVLIASPLVFQVAPSGPPGYQSVRHRLWAPAPSLAQSQTKTRILNDANNPHNQANSEANSGANPEVGLEAGQETAPPDPEELEPTPEPKVGAGGYLENGWLIWEELMPAGWDPVAILEDLDINNMADDDPRVDEVIDEFLRRWSESPTNPDINAQRLKKPGFVVPLDFEEEKVDEFFLVPFFWACIHVPPPPPNQIILVRLKKPIEGLGVMEVVWVYGKISVERVSTDIGASGYSLAADKIEFYQFDEETG